MQTLELFRASVQAIRTNKTRSFLTTLGIIIGVASVILLVSIGNGLQSFVTKQFADLGSNLVFVSPGKVNLKAGGGRPTGVNSKFTFDDVRNLDKLGDPVTRASAQMTKTGTAKYENKTYDVTIDGVDANYALMVKVDITKGIFITKNSVERSQAAVVVGPKVVENLLRNGEEPLGKEIDISGKKLKIIGVTKSKGGGLGGASDQDSMVYVPITMMQKITGSKNPVSIIVQANAPETTAMVTQKIKNYFYRRHLTDDDFTVLEPKEILATINTFLGAITGALSGIAAISLVVGGIGIANIMLVSVTERTREIGLRKAIGATNRDILAQFLIEAIMLSALGGAIGIAIGWGMSLVIKSVIETAVTAGSVILAFGISALVGIVSGFAPALRASKLNPIEALRWE